MTRGIPIGNEPVAQMAWPLMPRWAWMRPSPKEKSPLAHVNRRYHWHMGRLRSIRVSLSVITDKAHREACERILAAEERRVTAEFMVWKAANGYA